MDRLQVSIPTGLLPYLPEGASAENLQRWVVKHAQAAVPGRDLRLDVIHIQLFTKDDEDDDPRAKAGHLGVVVRVQIQGPLTDEVFSESMRGFEIPPWVVPYDGVWPNRQRQSFEACASIPPDVWMARVP